MASPSVPSISRLETSSESSSDSTSTTTSTASEHSKTNIINRYSCNVERVLYWYPRAYAMARLRVSVVWPGLYSSFTQSLGQWLRVRSTRQVAYPSTGYLFQLQGTFQAVKLKATNWHRGEFPLLPDDGSRVGNSKHRMVFLRQLSLCLCLWAYPSMLTTVEEVATIPGYWLHCQQVNITFCIDLVWIKPISIKE